MSDTFCRKFVDDLFNKYDKDGSNVLERGQLKAWLNEQLRTKPLHKKVVNRQFKLLIDTADTNGDGKIDRWEMYQYCLNSYTEQ